MTDSTLKIVLLFISFCFCGGLIAQPINDGCETPINIVDITNFCSEFGEYNNNNATPSGYGAATCFSNAANDVWFTFTAIATDVTIVVNGDSDNGTGGAGGTLLIPEVALYSNNCGGVIDQLECESDNIANNDIVELYKGGLQVGVTYLVRVQGFNGNEGTFQLCLNNYFPPVNPGSDCPIAAVLCNKDPFVLQQIVGAGSDPDELTGTCLGLGGNSESNSTWFSWICEDPGSLTFTLTPTNPSDDLDFVVYELPNGVDNCAGKQWLRCMASGDFAFPSPCMGPTGLADGETDISEPAGCNDPSQNSFLSPINMTAGTAYALAINNFSGTGNGFEIEWGGTGTFLGPTADYIVNISDSDICYGETVTFTDASSFSLGSLTGWEWDFGEDANPTTASGQGPHTVQWSSPGTKGIVLQVESDLGCVVYDVGEIIVDPCCDTDNQIGTSPIITDVLCAESLNGAIDLNINSNVSIESIEWSGGQNTEDLNNLPGGSYEVTITNEATCEEVFDFVINAPPPIAIEPIIQMPSCGGGMDGGITMFVTGGTFPYQYDFGSGFSSNNTLTGIPNGTYTVDVLDGNNCDYSVDVVVNELVLELDAGIPVVTPPSCDDTFDGQVEVVVENGVGPYMIDWNDGNGFVNNNLMDGLNTTTFDITFVDADGCLGDTTVFVVPPTPVDIDADVVNVSCFGLSDGMATAFGSGGVGGYTYEWSDGQIDSTATGLPIGTYFVTVTDANGCPEVSGLTITQPPELGLGVLDIVDVICFGDSTGVVTVAGNGGTPDYQYSVDGITFQDDPIFVNLPAEDLSFVVQDDLGCFDTLLVTVSQPDELIVNAGPDQTVDLGFEADINTITSPPFRPVDYFWDPAITLDCDSCPDPTAIPFNNTTYTVTILDEDGCTAEDEITIFVNKERPIYIPNVFSPNGDGFNDFWTIFSGPAASRIVKMDIFSRWGEHVFSAADIPLSMPSAGWDGTFRGESVNPEVYTFYVQVEFIDSEVILYEGSITIVK